MPPYESHTIGLTCTVTCLRHTYPLASTVRATRMQQPNPLVHSTLLNPDQCGDFITIDFIGPLPLDDSFDAIVTITDRLGSDIHIAATHTNITTECFAAHFFDLWYCDNGLPLNIMSDRD